MEADELAKRKKIEDLAIKYRGSIIHYFAEVEDIVDNIISDYFCNDRRKAFFLLSVLVADSLDFSPKEKILSFLTKIVYPDFSEKYPHLMTDIRSAQQLRNRVAHRRFNAYMVDLETYVEGEINLTIWSTDSLFPKEKKKQLNEKLCNEHAIKCRKCWSILYELWDNIKSESKPKE